jgi:hypothetical protein
LQKVYRTLRAAKGLSEAGIESETLQQQTKSLQAEAGRAETAVGLSKRIDSVKHLLWHGNVAEALERQAGLLLDLQLIRAHSAAAGKTGGGA